MDKITISPMVAVDQKNGTWRLHIRKSPEKRAKITYPGSFDRLMHQLIDMKAGKCETLQELTNLYRDLNSRIDGLTGLEEQSQQLQLVGINTAAKHADQVSPNWTEDALELLHRYPQERFLTEEFRAFAHAEGLPHPPDPRAWGAVMTRAARKELIQADGIDRTKSKVSHRRPATVWLNLQVNSRSAA